MQNHRRMEYLMKQLEQEQREVEDYKEYLWWIALMGGLLIILLGICIL